jgi:electron transfer flavoprotein alpha subunit
MSYAGHTAGLRLARTLVRLSVVTVALGTGLAIAAPRQEVDLAPRADDAKTQRPAAGRPEAARRTDPRKEPPVATVDPGPQLLKQPPMPMRRMTQQQRAAAAARLKVLREEDARRSGQPVPATRPMPQPQLLPINRVDK